MVFLLQLKKKMDRPFRLQSYNENVLSDRYFIVFKVNVLYRGRQMSFHTQVD